MTDAPMRMWMENTDRPYDTLGTDVAVRRYRQFGTRRLSGTVLEQMLPGDIVFHWWRGDTPPALVGWSVVTGHPTVFYNEHPGEQYPVDDDGHAPVPVIDDVAGERTGTFTTRETVGDMAEETFDKHYRHTWMSADLGGMWELDTPLTLPTVQQLASDVLAVADELQVTAGADPLVFPFDRADPATVRDADPHYLTAFPPALLDVLPGLPTVRALTTAASESLRSWGIDRFHDWRLHAALDQYAVDMAAAFLRRQDYTVTDVGAFEHYQLRAQRDGEQPLTITVVAGRGDIGPIRERGSMIVVDRIELLEDTSPTQDWHSTAGGRLRWWADSSCPAPDIDYTIPQANIVY